MCCITVGWLLSRLRAITSSICSNGSHLREKSLKKLRTSLLVASVASSEYAPSAVFPLSLINSTLCCTDPFKVWLIRAQGKLQASPLRQAYAFFRGWLKLITLVHFVIIRICNVFKSCIGINSKFILLIVQFFLYYICQCHVYFYSHMLCNFLNNLHSCGPFILVWLQITNDFPKLIPI